MDDEIQIIGTDALPPDVEFDELVARLNEQFPILPPRSIDFSRFKGSNRTAKAIVLHLCTSAGWTPIEVAESLDLSTPRVYQLLYDAIQDNVCPDDIETIRQFEIMKLDAWERMAIEGRDRSFGEEVVTTETETKDGTFTTTRTTPLQGNPAWSRVLTEIQKRRSALTGLDKPTKVSIDKTSRSLIVTEVVVKNREDVIALKNAGLLE